MVNKEEKYIFIGKSLYFPKEKILAIGDLHLGYEEMLLEQGTNIRLNQLKQTISDFDKIFAYLSKNKLDLKKIILLGDVKHYFSFSSGELNHINKLITYLSQHVSRENIIMVKGNHDTFSVAGKDFTDYFVFHDIAFIHGDREFLEIYDKNINYIIMSHLHPTVTLSDKMEIKKEKYKCFLVGKWKDKKTIVLPSFLPFIEGSSIENIENKHNDDNFSIIPKKEFDNFEVYVVGDDLTTKDFGKLKNLN